MKVIIEKGVYGISLQTTWKHNCAAQVHKFAGRYRHGET